MQTRIAPEPKADVRLTVPPHGVRTSKVRAHAYKFSGQAARLLMARNWREMGRGAAKYAYLAAPEASPS